MGERPTTLRARLNGKAKPLLVGGGISVGAAIALLSWLGISPANWMTKDAHAGDVVRLEKTLVEHDARIDALEDMGRKVDVIHRWVREQPRR